MKNNKEDISKLWMWVYRSQILNNKEKGNTLIIAMSLGLIVLLGTSVALFNSSKEKTNAQANEFTKQAIATTEAGLTRTLDKLSSKYPYYLKLTYNPNGNPTVDEWTTPPSGSINSPCAPSAMDLQNAVLTENLDNNRSYEIKSYVYDPTSQKGTLTLQGQKNDGSLNSKARLVAGLQITEYVPPNSYPGLYAESILNIGGNRMLQDPNTPSGESGDFNIICTECTAPSNYSGTTCVSGEPTQNYLRAAMGVSNNNNNVQGNLVLGVPKLPDYPAPPTNACSSTNTALLDNNDNTKNGCYILIDSYSSSQTFPRQTDIDNRRTWITTTGSSWYTTDSTMKENYLKAPYIYVIRRNGVNENGASRNSISGTTIVNSTYNVTIPGASTPTSLGTSFRFYVLGDIKLAGSSELQHNGTLEKLGIFGCSNVLRDWITTYNIGKVSPNTISCVTDQEFKLNGNTSAVNVFIYAPEANVGVNGSSMFTTVIWSKAWDMSNASVGGLTVPYNAEELLSQEFGSAYGNAGITFNRISQITDWTRVEASN